MIASVKARVWLPGLDLLLAGMGVELLLRIGQDSTREVSTSAFLIMVVAEVNRFCNLGCSFCNVSAHSKPISNFFAHQEEVCQASASDFLFAPVGLVLGSRTFLQAQNS